MPEDYFENSQPASGSNGSYAGDKQDGGDQHDEPTFLINSEVCPDLKPGETLKLRVVGVHDGEYEVQYEMEEEKEPEKASAPPPQSDPETASMMD